MSSSRPRRSGARIEHFYRTTAHPFVDAEHWARIPPPMRSGLFDHMLRQVWEHVCAASEDGGFEDERAHISWTTLELDERAYEELAAELGSLIARATELGGEAKTRPADGGRGNPPVHRTELSIMHFHRAAEEQPSAASD